MWAHAVPRENLVPRKSALSSHQLRDTRNPCLTWSSSRRGDDEKPSEMFDNPLYGSIGKSHGRGKEPDLQQKDHLTPPDSMYPPSRAADEEPDRPPVPTPRNRSFTCSDTKPQPSVLVASHPSAHKKPVMPSRSEGGSGPNRPPLPVKSRPAMPEPQMSKPRDYRDSAELPNKLRVPARPGQSQTHKDRK